MLLTPKQWLSISRAVVDDAEPLEIRDKLALFEFSQTKQLVESFSDGLLVSNSIIELFADCARFCDQTETEVYLRPVNRTEFDRLAAMYQLDVQEYQDGQVAIEFGTLV